MSASKGENRSLPRLEGVTNFRELGGLAAHGGRTVRPRRLFRSGHWGGASDRDVERLTALGVTVVFDFRSDADIAFEGPDRLPEGVELVRLAAVDPAGAVDLRGLILESGPEELHEHFGEGRAEARMREAAAGLVTERTGLYAEFLSRLAAPGAAPALFHCSAGKDRAGWAASVVLLALGVAEEDVVDHYLLSNRHYRPARNEGAAPGAKAGREIPAEIAALLKPLLGVKPEYAAASLDAAREAFGSVEAYLNDGLEMTERKRRQLRENWLA